MSLVRGTAAVRALEAGCKRLQLPDETATELVRYLQVQRVHDQFLPSHAKARSMSPGAALDKLWRFMLLNTDISSKVHELVGGIVRRTGTDEDDLDNNAEKMQRLYALNIMAREGYQPDARLWAESGTSMSQIDQVRQMDGMLLYVCPNMTAAESAALKADLARSTEPGSCSPKDNRPGGGFVAAANDGDTGSGPAEGAAAHGVPGHQPKSARGGQQAVRRFPRAQVEQQIQGVRTAAATPAAAAAAGACARARAARRAGAAAAAEPLDLCNNDEEEEQSQQQQQQREQQQHQTDDPAVSGGKRARRNAAASTAAHDLQKKAWDIVLERFLTDRKSITDVHAVISNEFCRYQMFSQELRIPGVVPDCDRKAVQDIIMQGWNMKKLPAQDLLPYLVGFIAVFATNQQASHNNAHNRWAGMLNGKQQQQQHVSKKPRTTSAACGAATTAATTAAPDSKQRPAAALKDVEPRRTEQKLASC